MPQPMASWGRKLVRTVTVRCRQCCKGESRQARLGLAGTEGGRRRVSGEFLLELSSQTPCLAELSTRARSHLHQTSAWSASFLFICLLPLRHALCIVYRGQVVRVHFSCLLRRPWDRRSSVLHGFVLPVVTCLGTIRSLHLE